MNSGHANIAPGSGCLLAGSVKGQAGKKVPGIILIVLLAALVGIVAGSAVQSLRRVAKSPHPADGLEINDFDRWLFRLPAHLDAHADLTDERSANTVLDMLSLWPFIHLPRAAAHVVWTFCKLPMVLAIAGFMRSMVRRAGVELSAFSVLAICFAWLWPVLGDIQEGQTNLLMLLPLIVGLWYAQGDGRLAPWLAGLFIALSVAIKVTPLIFLPWLLLRRRFGIAGAMLAGLLVWFFGLPALAFGWSQNLAWQREWFGIMIVPFFRGQVHVTMGESLASFLTKLLCHVPAFVSDKTGAPVAHYMNVMDLPASVVGWLIRALLLGIAGAGAWWMRRPLASLRTRRFLFEIAALACFMLWASSWTLVAHYVTLLLPLVAVGMIQSDARAPAKLRRRAAAALVAAALLMLLTSDAAKFLFGPDGRELMLAFNVCFLSSLLLAAVIARGASVDLESRAPGGRGRDSGPIPSVGDARQGDFVPHPRLLS